MPLGTSVLLIGYGNPGRRDDGLGPALAERMEKKDLKGVDIVSDYQLNIEHAHDLAAYDVVIFADAQGGDLAGRGNARPFDFKPLKAGNPTSFSTHSVSPQAVLRLAEDLFQAQTRAYLLGITGFEFVEIQEKLTDMASANLDHAEEFISDWLADLLK